MLDLPTEVCIAGALSRVGIKRDDIPWVENELNENFKQSILNFSRDQLPEIYKYLDEYKDSLNIIIFKSRTEIDEYIENIKLKKYVKDK